MSLDKKTVARRYARALFELVDADNEIDQTYQELIALRQVFEDNEGLEGALAGVQMSFANKKPWSMLCKRELPSTCKT